MQNLIQRGLTLNVVAPTALTGGQAFSVNATTELAGVATETVASGAVVATQIFGVIEITAVSAETGAIGAKVYLDSTATPAFSRVTTVLTANRLAGVLAATKSSGELTARVHLNVRLT